jgi:hypothetical protein
MKKKTYYMDEVWVARDGRRFGSERECAIYDKFCCKHPKDFLSPYMVFSNWGTKTTPPWKIEDNYCTIFAEVPEEILEYLQLYIVCEYSNFPKYCSYFRGERNPLLLYNGVTRKSNGVHWNYFGDIECRKSHVQYLKKKIDFINKLLERRA